MAANIMELDGQAGLEMAWHKMTRIPESGILTPEFAFPYDIVGIELYLPGEVRAGGYRIPVSSDNGLPVGKPFHPDSYTLQTPKDIWGLLECSLAGLGSRFVSAGTVGNRSKMFISAEVPQLAEIDVANRKVRTVLSGMGSMDGSLTFNLSLTSFWVVCQNTLNMALNQAIYTLKHTKNMPTRIQEVPEIIDSAVGIRAQFKDAMESLAEVRCNPSQARELFVGFEVPASESEMSTQVRNRADKLVELHVRGLGNRGETLLDTASAYTQFASREVNKPGNEWKRFESSEFGLGARRKSEFVTMLGKRDEREMIAKRGAELIAKN